VFGIAVTEKASNINHTVMQLRSVCLPISGKNWRMDENGKGTIGCGSGMVHKCIQEEDCLIGLVSVICVVDLKVDGFEHKIKCCISKVK